MDIPGELGPCPPGSCPAPAATWVITVHGLGTTREHPMNVLRPLHRQQFPVLDLAYRGDPGAPRSRDGLGPPGRDRVARPGRGASVTPCGHGAEHVILYGWSTGATMALHAAARSALRDRISGLVLDSPVLDWRGHPAGSGRGPAHPGRPAAARGTRRRGP